MALPNKPLGERKADVVALEVRPGVVQLSGFLPRHDEVESLVKDLQRELPDLQIIETRIMTIDWAAQALRKHKADLRGP